MTGQVEWAEVLEPFSYSPKEDAITLMNRLTRNWCAVYGIPKVRLGPHVPARRERWSHRRVGRHIAAMIKADPRMKVTAAPRFDKGALVLVEFEPGLVGQIDGRHRANLWRQRPGRYDIIILEVWKCAS